MSNGNFLRSIEVVGEAEKTFISDIVNVKVSIVIVRDTVREAKKAHSDLQIKLLKLLGTLGIEQKAVQTTYRNDNKLKKWNKEGTEQITTGYRVHQGTNIKTNVDVAEKIIEQVEDLGKDISASIGSMEFSGINELKNEGLEDAIDNARIKAEKRCVKLGVLLGDVLFCSENLEDNSVRYQPAGMRMASVEMVFDSAGSGHPETHIDVGEGKFTAKIKVVYEIENSAKAAANKFVKTKTQLYRNG